MKGIVFDIHETLTGALSSFPETGFKRHSKDVVILPGVLAGMEFHHRQGYIMVGASNQGGCSAINPETGEHYKSIEDAIAEMQFTLSLLPHLQSIYFCPDFQGAECYKVTRDKGIKISPTGMHTQLLSFRKPGAGMLTQAAIDYGFDLSQSWMIGSKAEDMESADGANCEFMDSETWRMRFSPGVSEIRTATLSQIEFLERLMYKAGSEG